MRPIRPDEVTQVAVRAQYAPGAVAGRAVQGYLQEAGVNPASRAETFAALKLHIDNWRWSGVPFYLRTGKRLAKRVTEVAIVFLVPHMVFAQSPVDRRTERALRFAFSPTKASCSNSASSVNSCDLNVANGCLNSTIAMEGEVLPPNSFQVFSSDETSGFAPPALASLNRFRRSLTGGASLTVPTAARRTRRRKACQPAPS